MDLSENQLEIMQQAVGYAVMYAPTEEETEKFAVLKVQIDTELIKKKKIADLTAEHDKMNCPFNYCSYNPKCEHSCRHSSN